MAEAAVQLQDVSSHDDASNIISFPRTGNTKRYHPTPDELLKYVIRSAKHPHTPSLLTRLMMFADVHTYRLDPAQLKRIRFTWLADELGWSRATLRRSLTELKDMHLIGGYEPTSGFKNLKMYFTFDYDHYDSGECEIDAVRSLGAFYAIVAKDLARLEVPKYVPALADATDEPTDKTDTEAQNDHVDNVDNYVDKCEERVDNLSDGSPETSELIQSDHPGGNEVSHPTYKTCSHKTTGNTLVNTVVERDDHVGMSDGHVRSFEAAAYEHPENRSTEVHTQTPEGRTIPVDHRSYYSPAMISSIRTLKDLVRSCGTAAGDHYHREKRIGIDAPFHLWVKDLFTGEAACNAFALWMSGSTYRTSIYGDLASDERERFDRQLQATVYTAWRRGINQTTLVTAIEHALRDFIQDPRDLGSLSILNEAIDSILSGQPRFMHFRTAKWYLGYETDGGTFDAHRSVNGSPIESYFEAYALYDAVTVDFDTAVIHVRSYPSRISSMGEAGFVDAMKRAACRFPGWTIRFDDELVQYNYTDEPNTTGV